jgi:transcriptional regulator with XRE-family HTH domain
LEVVVLSAMSEALREVLRAEFENRKSKNKNYSMRAFARDLGLNIASVSEFFNNKRNFSKRSLEMICAALSIPANSMEESQRKAVQHFRRGFHHKAIAGKAFDVLLSDWLPYAILNVASVPAHSASPDWLARHFGVTAAQAQACLDALLDLEMIQITDGKIIRPTFNLTTSDDIPSETIRNFHKMNLRKAAEALDTVDVKQREFTSTTFAMSQSDLLEIKNYIRKFRRHLARRFSSPNADAVYSLSLQLYPLTRPAEQAKGENP